MLFRSTMDRFYAGKFGGSYQPENGLIRFSEPKGFVKGRLAAPCNEAVRDPEVQFFLEKNPDYGEGVELACIAEIRVRDFLGHIPKYFLFRRKRAS